MSHTETIYKRKKTERERERERREMATYRLNSVLACTECSSSWSSDLFDSSARASRLGDEPNAGGGCMLEFEKALVMLNNNQAVKRTW